MLMLAITLIATFIIMLVSYVSNARSVNQQRSIKGEIHSSWRYVQKDKLVYRDTYTMVSGLYKKEG